MEVLNFMHCNLFTYFFENCKSVFYKHDAYKIQTCAAAIVFLNGWYFIMLNKFLQGTTLPSHFINTLDNKSFKIFFKFIHITAHIMFCAWQLLCNTGINVRTCKNLLEFWWHHVCSLCFWRNNSRWPYRHFKLTSSW